MKLALMKVEFRWEEHVKLTHIMLALYNRGSNTSVFCRVRSQGGSWLIKGRLLEWG